MDYLKQISFKKSGLSSKDEVKLLTLLKSFVVLSFKVEIEVLEGLEKEIECGRGSCERDRAVIS